MNNAQRVKLLGVPVDIVADMAGALRTVQRLVEDSVSPRTVLAVNPEKIYQVRSSPLLQEIFENAGLLIPDGIGVVFGLRMLYKAKVSRVAGADLMQEICALSAREGWPVFIYGASETVGAGAYQRLEQRYPGLKIAGRKNGYVADMNEIVDAVNSSGARILFVALGSPRQERWMLDYAKRLTSVHLIQGIGGTLDTIEGSVRRAPLWFQRHHLEWFYRLCRQPSRLFRQVVLLRFTWEIFTAGICKGMRR